jgi:Uncharacterized alpha/beta hydrolase domain (DUF2235)
MANNRYTRLGQPQGNLQSGADAASKLVSGTIAAARVSPDKPAVEDKVFAARSAGEPPPQGSCQQTLTLTYFFDGTGNNLDADKGTKEHSNVARLYRVHLDDDEAQGVYRFYIPGIGTYFKDIGDAGGT